MKLDFLKSDRALTFATIGLALGSAIVGETRKNRSIEKSVNKYLDKKEKEEAEEKED